MHEFGFIFAGFFVGLVVGLTGVGGGSLMTPILIFFFGIKPYLAVGTDLLFAAFTKGAGTLSLAQQRLGALARGVHALRWQFASLCHHTLGSARSRPR